MNAKIAKKMLLLKASTLAAETSVCSQQKFVSDLLLIHAVILIRLNVMTFVRLVVAL